MFGKKKGDEVSAGGGKADPNPYLGNRVESDDRNRNLAVEKHNWQTAWRLTVALLAMSMGFNGYYMVQSKFIPVPVFMDNVGNVIQVGAVDRSTKIDPKRIKRAEILNWIENCRVVYGDNLAEKKAIKGCYSRVSKQGKTKSELDDFFRERAVFDMAKNGMGVSVEFHTALPVGDHVFQVDWTEATRNAEGKVVAVQNWKGNFTFDVSPADTDEGIALNPNGFFITDYSWSKTI